MRGEVLTYDDGPGTGLISGDDGVRYRFSRADLQQLTPVRAGMKVDFIPVDGAATEIIITSGAPVSSDVGVAGGMGGTIDWKKLFFEANGRIAQKDFWIGFAILFIGGLVVGLIPLIGPLIALALIYCWVCLYSKRLHDMGKSGWLAAIPTGLPALVGFLAFITALGAMGSAAMYGDHTAMIAGMGMVGMLAILSFVVIVVFAIWCGVTPGQPHDNAYGPPPQPLANV